MSQTKKSRCLPLSEKIKIIEEAKKGSSVTYLAKKYGIAKSTICAIKNKSERIASVVSSTYNGPGKRKTMKQSKIPRTEKHLYKWFLQQRNRHLPVNGVLMKQMGLKLYKMYEGRHGGNFNASDGWMQNFKKRFGIRFIKIAGEKLSSQPELVEPFKKKLREKMLELGITKDQLYNADETGLYYKCLPEKTYVTSQERSAPGRKSAKERITFLACTNASGCHKIKPLVIGKSKKPRPFKNIDLPVEYKNSKSAWMTSNIFKDWFHNSFVSQVRIFMRNNNLSPKALLILDNAPSHPPADELVSDDGLITTLYMPPNITPILQPMDQNVIRLTKLHYRSSLLAMVIGDKSDNVSAILKNINLKNAVFLLSAAWDKLLPEIIEKCFNVLFSDDVPSEDSDDDDTPLSIVRQNILQTEAHTLEQQHVSLLQEIFPENRLLVEDIQLWNQDATQVELLEKELDSDIECVEDNSSDEQCQAQNSITNNEVIFHINQVLLWAEQNKLQFSDLFLIRKLREKAVLAAHTQTQAKITDYFKERN